VLFSSRRFEICLREEALFGTAYEDNVAGQAAAREDELFAISSAIEVPNLFGLEISNLLRRANGKRYRFVAPWFVTL
jgi:hypothetical protein